MVGFLMHTLCVNALQMIDSSSEECVNNKQQNQEVSLPYQNRAAYFYFLSSHQLYSPNLYLPYCCIHTYSLPFHNWEANHLLFQFNSCVTQSNPNAINQCHFSNIIFISDIKSQVLGKELNTDATDIILYTFFYNSTLFFCLLIFYLLRKMLLNEIIA